MTIKVCALGRTADKLIPVKSESGPLTAEAGPVQVSTFHRCDRRIIIRWETLTKMTFYPKHLLFITFHWCAYWPYLYSNHVQKKSTKCALITAPRFSLILHIDWLDPLNFILLFEKETKLWYAQRRWTSNTKKRGFLKCFLSSKLFPSQKAFLIPCIFNQEGGY